MSDNPLNSMQAYMGLGGSGMGSSAPPTPSAGDTSLRLMHEAAQRQSLGVSIISNATMSVSRQFQTQFQGIKDSQSMPPYMAQMLQASHPGDSPLPSPFTMTPAITGNYRPAPPPPTMAMMPPTMLPSMFQGPFSPRMPAPMFQSQVAQYSQAGDLAANRAFSYASQAPGVMGTGLGIGASAMFGARVGAGFGPWGAAVGAGVGALAGHGSGFATGMGNMFNTVMGGSTENAMMGARIQHSTQDFVTSGMQLSGTGRGLTRSASMDLARGVRDVAGDTPGFNRADLMNVMGHGGKAGLFDMAQSVPDIKNKLRETAQTVQQFMSLTNDPDVVNVIRRLGQLNQMGLSQQQMVQAAQGLNMYARQAGTTTAGVQQIGGLPGAATFQGAGLTAGTGFQYGNYAAASARNLVATGNMSPQQLALLGGVQGITQRDIQAQASFMSMPLYGAMNARYTGAGGWAAGAPAAGGGAFGMVNQAYQNISAGVREGGLGALAMFPLQSRRVADTAASNMTPEEMMAQRFQFASATGERLRIPGLGGFAAGAQIFGPEVAEQMLVQAQTPGFFQTQRRGIQRRQHELAVEQAAVDRDRTFIPNLGIGTALERSGSAIRGGLDRITGGIGDWAADLALPDGVVRTRRDRGVSINDADQAAGVVSRRKAAASFEGLGDVTAGSVAGNVGINGLRTLWDISKSGRSLGRAQTQDSSGWMGALGGVMGVLSMGTMDSTDMAGFIGAGSALSQSTGDVQRQISRSLAAGMETAQEIHTASKMSIDDRISLGRKHGGYEKTVRAADHASKALKKLGATSIWSGITSGNLTGPGQAQYNQAIDDAARQAHPNFDKLPDAAQKEIRQGIISDLANRGGGMGDYIARREKESGEHAAGILKDTSEAIAKQATEKLETLADEMGLETSGWYLWADDTEGIEGMKALAKSAKTTDAETILMAASGAEVGSENYKAAEAAWRKAGGKGVFLEERDKILTSGKYKGLAEATRSALTEAGESGKYEKISEFGATTRGAAMAGVYTSDQTGKGVAGIVDSGAYGAFASGGGKDGAAGFAKTVTKKGLERLRKKDDKLAGSIDALQKGTGTAADEERVNKYLIGFGGGGEVEDTTGAKAKGPEADRLERSDNALQGMAKIVADFRPAVKEFKEGAKELREVAEQIKLANQ